MRYRLWRREDGKWEPMPDRLATFETAAAAKQEAK